MHLNCRPTNSDKEQFPPLSVLIEPAIGKTGDWECPTGDDAAEGVITMNPSASPRSVQPGFVAGVEDLGDDLTWHNEGDGYFTLKINEGVEAAILHNVLVLHVHVPPTICAVCPGLHLDACNDRLVGCKDEDVDGWSSRGCKRRQKALLVKTEEHVVLTSRPN